MRVHACLLYTPILRVDSLARSTRTRADIVVLDLEDSIPKGAKAAARERLATADLARVDLPGLGLRINSIATPDGLADLSALIDLDGRIGGVPLDVIFVPKVSTASDVGIYRSLLSGLSRPPEICSFIETVDAVENAHEIAAVSDGLCFGQADLESELYAVNESYLDHARARLCVAAAKHRLPAIDTNSFELRDLAKVRAQSEASRAVGFTGKAAIHPGQVDTISEVFTVGEDELSRYQATIEDYAADENGFAVADDRVLAPPFVLRAQRMLRLYSGAR